MPYTDQQVAAALLGQARRWRFRHDVIAADGGVARVADVVSAQVSNNDLADKVKRTGRYRLAPAEASRFDYSRERLRSHALLEMPDGGWHEWAVGTFLLSRAASTWGARSSVVTETVEVPEDVTAEVVNLSPAPRRHVAPSNFGAPNLTVTTGVTVTGHPHGITTAARYQRGQVGGTAPSAIAHNFNSDGLGDYGAARVWGVWARPQQAGYVGQVYSGGNQSGTFRSVALPANVWTWVATTVLGAGHGIFAVVREDGANAPTTDTVEVAGVAASTAAPLTYFDGDTLDVGVAAYSWLGTPGASPSIRRTTDTFIQVENMSTNPRPTTYSGGAWSVSNSRWWGPSGSAGNYTIESGDTPLGPGFARKTWTAVSTGGTGDTGFEVHARGGVVTPGGKWLLSGWLRSSRGGQNSGIAAYFSTGRVNAAGPVLAAGVWTRVAALITVPAGATLNYFAVDLQGGTAWQVGDTLDLTGIMLCPVDAATTIPPDYFDGDVADTGADTYVWTGTPHASTSIRQTRDNPHARPYADVILADQPVGYWRLDETTAPNGGRVTDSSGNEQHGEYRVSTTASAGFTFTTPGAVIGDTGTAVTLAATAAYPRLRWTGSAWLPIGGRPYTLEAWVRTTTTRGKALWTYGGGNQLLVSVAATGTTLYHGGSTVAFGHADLTDGAWHHLVVTYNGGQAAVWVDGAGATKTFTATVADAGPAAWVVVGQEQDLNDGGYDTSQGWEGDLDELAAYDRALTAEDVARHYQAGRALLPPVRQVTRTVTTPVTEAADVEGYDPLLVLVEDAVLDRYVVAAGTNYRTAVVDVLAAAGFTGNRIASTALTLPAAREWPPGTPRLTIINDLLAAIDFRPLVMDAYGVPTSGPYLEPEHAPILWTYTVDRSSVIVPGIDVALDLHDVPNAWLAVVSEADRPPLVASAVNDDPASPLSTVNRGRRIVRVLGTEPGSPGADGTVEAASQAVLDAKVARAKAEATQQWETAEFDTGLMPVHGSGDVCLLDYGAGLARFREHEWSMDLRAGGQMRHRFRRVVSL